MVALLKQCCCGCSLRTGSIIIGILYVIGGLYIVISSGLALAAINSADNSMSNLLNSLNDNSTESDSDLHSVLTRIKSNLQASNSTLKDLSWYLVLNLIIRSIELIASIIMLVGVVKEKPKFLPPWIIVALIILALCTLEYITLGIQFAMHDMVLQAVSHFVGLLIGIFISLYFIYVVYSHYHNMRSESERPKYDSAPQNQI